MLPFFHSHPIVCIIDKGLFLQTQWRSRFVCARSLLVSKETNTLLINDDLNFFIYSTRFYTYLMFSLTIFFVITHCKNLQLFITTISTCIYFVHPWLKPWKWKKKTLHFQKLFEQQQRINILLGQGRVQTHLNKGAFTFGVRNSSVVSPNTMLVI